MNIKKTAKKTQKAFTLIELLIAVAIIAILSGVGLTVLNPSATRNRANDGVRMANLDRIAQGIEAFYAAEGRLPAHNATVGATQWNPLFGTDGAALGVYLNSWPSDANYRYSIVTEANKPYICASVLSATGSNLVYKYVSPWDSNHTGGRSECAGKIIICSEPPSPVCSTSFQSNDLGGCTQLNGSPCT